MKKAKKISERLYPHYEGTEKMVSIHYDQRAVREANRLGATIYKLTGEWTGYSYDVKDRFVLASTATKIKIILKKIDEKNQKRKVKKETTLEQRIARWARRLDRITGCGIETATAIANKKINAEASSLEKQLDFQPRGWRYPAWYRQAERRYDRCQECPASLLRPISDTDHAHAILGAHYRHSETNYEEMLEKGRELADIGEIDRGDIQEYARRERR